MSVLTVFVELAFTLGVELANLFVFVGAVLLVTSPLEVEFARNILSSISVSIEVPFALFLFLFAVFVPVISCTLDDDLLAFYRKAIEVQNFRFIFFVDT